MKPLLRMLGVGVLAVMMSGCWPTPGAGPDRRSFNPYERTLTPEAVPQLNERFRHPLPGGTGPPVATAAGVFVRSDETVTALEPGSGALRWSFSISGGFTLSNPFILDADRVLVSFALPRSGEYIQDVVMRLDTRTGVEEYEAETRGSLDSLRGTRMGTIEHDTVFSNGTSVSVEDLDTGSFWGGYTLEAAGGRVSLGEDLLFLATDGQVQAYDPEIPCPDYSGDLRIPTCSSTWARSVGGSATPVVIGDDATVYAGSADGSLYALRSDTGGIRWTAPLGAAVNRPPALAGGMLYAAGADGRLSAMPADGCGFLRCPVSWSTEPGAEITVQPAVAGRVVYTGSADGTLQAFDAAGCGAAACAPLWTADAGAPVTGGLAVYGGRLFVTTDTALIGYGLPA